MLHSSVHIQIFTERNSINVSLSRVGLHKSHGKQHIDILIRFDNPGNRADNMFSLAGNDLAGYLLKPVWMVLTGRNAHKGTKIVFLTKVIHVLAEFLYCLFLFFCNHFC